jgi:hypothetical protein
MAQELGSAQPEELNGHFFGETEDAGTLLARFAAAHRGMLGRGPQETEISPALLPPSRPESLDPTGNESDTEPELRPATTRMPATGARTDVDWLLDDETGLQIDESEVKSDRITSRVRPKQIADLNPDTAIPLRDTVNYFNQTQSLRSTTGRARTWVIPGTDEFPKAPPEDDPPSPGHTTEHGRPTDSLPLPFPASVAKPPVSTSMDDNPTWVPPDPDARYDTQRDVADGAPSLPRDEVTGRLQAAEEGLPPGVPDRDADLLFESDAMLRVGGSFDGTTMSSADTVVDAREQQKAQEAEALPVDEATVVPNLDAEPEPYLSGEPEPRQQPVDEAGAVPAPNPSVEERQSSLGARAEREFRDTSALTRIIAMQEQSPKVEIRRETMRIVETAQVIAERLKRATASARAEIAAASRRHSRTLPTGRFATGPLRDAVEGARARPDVAAGTSHSEEKVPGRATGAGKSTERSARPPSQRLATDKSTPEFDVGAAEAEVAAARASETAAPQDEESEAVTQVSREERRRHERRAHRVPTWAVQELLRQIESKLRESQAPEFASVQDLPSPAPAGTGAVPKAEWAGPDDAPSREHAELRDAIDDFHLRYTTRLPHHGRVRTDDFEPSRLERGAQEYEGLNPEPEWRQQGRNGGKRPAWRTRPAEPETRLQTLLREFEPRRYRVVEGMDDQTETPERARWWRRVVGIG